MKKIYAWTMVEMVIALTILILLSGMCVSVYKPNVQKARIMIYATMKNLSQGNLAIMEANDSSLEGADFVSGSTTYDFYCMKLADAFSLESMPDCKIQSEKTKNVNINITFPSGVTLQGLTNEWKIPYADSDFKFKNIVVDIDGNKGVNKVGIDRFPLRIYSGSAYTGAIQIVDCKSDILYDFDGNSVTLSESDGKSPYCQQGFQANGAQSNASFSLDNKIVSYDIYRAMSSDEESTAEIVASNLAPMEADCGAYGGEGFYHKKQCLLASNKINGEILRIKTKCATSANCSICDDDGDICPRNKDNTSTTSHSTCETMAADINPDDLPCFTLLHKPSGGTTFLLETLIGQFDM